KGRDGVEWSSHPGVAKIECVVHAGGERHVEIHPLHGRRARVVDRLRGPGPAYDAGRPLDGGCAAVDRELRFSVENDEHLFDGVVKVVADARSGREHTARSEENTSEL